MHQYIKLRNSNTVIRDFNTPHIHHWIAQTENKEMAALKDTFHHIDITDTFRTIHPEIEYTFFLSAHGTLSNIL